MNRSSSGGTLRDELTGGSSRGLKALARTLGFSIATVIGTLGILGVASPGAFVRAVSFFQAPPILYIAAVLRFILGAGLAWSASVSRLPRLLTILGVIIAIGGLATPFVGTRIARPILESWASGGPALVRVWGAGALALAAFVAYGFARRSVPDGAS